MGRFRKNSVAEPFKDNDSFRKIEISSIDQIIRGQVTDKFVKQK
jgi:hypothetical protein